MAGTPADLTRLRQLLEQLLAELNDPEATATTMTTMPQPRRRVLPFDTIWPVIHRVLPLVTIGLVIGAIYLEHSNKGTLALFATPVALGCAVYVIRSQRYSDADRKWAYIALGTLAGYWVGIW